MAKIKIADYVFDASAKTIEFTDVDVLSLDGVLLVTNVTRGEIIYNFADPTKVGTVDTNILTLNDSVDTGDMEDDDALLIYYDDSEPTEVIVGNVTPGGDPDQNMQYTQPKLTYGTEVSTDGLMMSGPGFFGSLLVNCTTAGTLVVRDAVAAGAGTIIKTLSLTVGCYVLPFNHDVGTGIYLDYGTVVATLNTTHRAYL